MIKNWLKQRASKNVPSLGLPQIPVKVSKAVELDPSTWLALTGEPWPETSYGPASGIAAGDLPIVNATIPKARKASIAAHEEMHALFFEVEEKYGESAKNRLVKNLLDCVNPIARQYLHDALLEFGYNRKKKTQIQEEMLVYLHTYQTDNVNRARINHHLGSKTKVQFFAKAANESWTNIIKVAQTITPSDLEGLPFKKNIPDDDLDSLSNMDFHKKAAQFIDPSYHQETFNAANKFPSFLKAEDKRYPRGVIAGGVTSKKLYGHKGDIYMVKNYHQKPRHFDYSIGNRSPIMGGWATFANAGLYDAGKIGHLNEDVALHKQNDKNIVIHKFAKGFNTLFERRDELPKTVQSNDLAKIAIMDFLSNNQDRHADNIVVHPDGQVKAIDHERSFQYHKNEKELKTLHDYFIRSGLSMLHTRNGGLDLGDVAGWWQDNSQDIHNELNKHLIAIKDPQIRDHIRNNFTLRHSIINDWANDVANQARDHFRPAGMRTDEANVISMPVDRIKVNKIIAQAGGAQDPVKALSAIAQAVNNRAIISPAQTKNIGSAVQELVDNIDEKQAKDLYAHITQNPAYNNGNMASIGVLSTLLNSVSNRKDGNGHAQAILNHIRSMDLDEKKHHQHHADKLRSVINEEA